MGPPSSGNQAEAALRSAKATIDVEVQALQLLAEAMAEAELGAAFAAATALIAAARGRMVVSGMGKSGLVARKTAATLASTGTPAFFIHPAEASHGDLGMITLDDVVIALSWSGETCELFDVVNYCRSTGVSLIAITSDRNSTLAQHADVALIIPRVQEACPHQLAPTSSALVQLALGDALAIALLDARGFSAEDFKLLHPRGKLAAQLRTVGELMSAGEELPQVGEHAAIQDAVLEMSSKRFGVTAVVGAGGMLIGSFTDGDLRRSLLAGGLGAPVRAAMTAHPVAVPPAMLAQQALGLMNARNITQLFVCEGTELVGIIHLHDILRVQVA